MFTAVMNNSSITQIPTATSASFSTDEIKWINSFEEQLQISDTEVDVSLSSKLQTSINYFPSDVLKWMKINANPRQAYKLIQVCKFFLGKYFPCIVLKGITNNNGGTWNYRILGEDKVEHSETLDIFPDGSLFISKLLHLYKKSDLITALLPKIAICEALDLYLLAQKLTLAEFKILTSSKTFVKINLSLSIITDYDDKPAALENILHCLPKARHLYFKANVPSIVSCEGVGNIVRKLQTFDASHITDAFNFETFTFFMKTHPYVRYQLTYDFNRGLSHYYKSVLQNYVNQIVKNYSTCKYPPPIINFPEQKSKYALSNLRKRYNNRRRNSYY